MQAIREIKIANTDTILLSVPRSFRNKRIEILMFPVEKNARDKTARGKSNFSKMIDELSWNMGKRLYGSREELYARN